MKKSKYVDRTAILNVLGNIYKTPTLLDANDKYSFNEEDFVDDIHILLFKVISNLHNIGAEEINLNLIEDYLLQRPKQYAVYKNSNGAELLTKINAEIKPETFPYYYNRMKKMTLLRQYNEKVGMDLSWLYDIDNIFEPKKKQEQEEWLNNASLEQIAKLIDDKISEIRNKFAEGVDDSTCHIATGLDEFLDSLKESPDYGYPLYGSYINAITRGARFGKLYLRSAATNVGKTRAMVADACYIACEQMFDLKTQKWISIGVGEPTLFIATEQDINEIQLSCLAFISGVNEEHISTNTYYSGEVERVTKAIQILKNSKLIFESLPDFSLGQIENLIKRSINEQKTKFIFLDYIHTSLGILAEITKRGGGIKLREDNVLFMMATQLKNIAVQYKVFILSSTQLNSNYQDAEIYDQNLLRGAKSIADSIDIGAIMLETTAKDKEALAPLCKQYGIEMPNVKMSIYKNRGNRWKSILLWMNADRGICRFDTVFVTSYDYTLQDITDIKLKVEEPGAF